MSATIALDEAGVDVLRRILPFAAKPELRRPVLRAVCFRGDTAVTTDGYRLSVAYFDGPGPAWTDILFDAKALAKQLPRTGDWEANGEVPIMQGAFPKWEGLVRSCRWSFSVSIRRAELLAALSVLPKPVSDCAILAVFDSGSSRLVVQDYHSHPSEVTTLRRLDVEITTTADAAPVYLNARFLRDLVRASRAKTLTFDCEDAVRPVMLREPGLTQLLMPVRVVA